MTEESKPNALFALQVTAEGVVKDADGNVVTNQENENKENKK